VASACQGDAEALETLLRRHQLRIFNIALRMLQTREDAEDATQEVLLKIATRLSSFRGDSSFRTWAYRIMANHVLDRQRSRPEQVVHGFDCYGEYLESIPSEEFPPEFGSAQERAVLVTESKRSCMLGLLLCLDRRERLVFVLGEIFEVSDTEGAQALEMSRDNFRQLLSRARRQIYSFMGERCGLFDPRNPCRCAAKTRAFIRDGIVDPGRLVFVESALAEFEAQAGERVEGFSDLVTAGQRRLYQTQPFFQAPDMAGRIRQLIESRELRAHLDLGLPN
jgi:RNA polymerase sigma factor (sigma-70 family)